MADQIPVTPGAQTSEHALTSRMMLIGSLISFIAMALAALPAPWNANPIVVSVGTVIGLLVALFSKLGYVNSRTAIKVASIKATALRDDQGSEPKTDSVGPSSPPTT